MSDAFHTAVEKLEQAGLRLNNLFQMPSGYWRANVTDGKLYFDFFDSKDPILAIEGAITNRGEGVAAYQRRAEVEKTLQEIFSTLDFSVKG